MALPTLITVIGKLLRADGTPSKGHVYFYSDISVLHSGDESVMIPSYIRAVVDADTGEFTCDVPASNDPAWTPEGWTWRVVVNTPTFKDDFLTVVPYDAPGGEIEFSKLVEASSGGNELYAAYNHTHPSSGDAVTSVSGRTGDVILTKDDVGLSNVDDTSDLDKPISTATQTELDTKLDKDSGVVVDSTLTVRKSDFSSAMRLRSTGGAVDFDKTNGDILVTSFAGPGFTGVETALQRWRANGSTFAGYTEFGDTVYGGAQFVDGQNGTSKFNLASGSGMSPLIFMGRKGTSGAPSSGAWDAGMAVLDSDGRVWYCTVSGTPGTWV